MKNNGLSIKQAFVLILKLLLISIPATVPSLFLTFSAKLFTDNKHIVQLVNSLGMLLSFVLTFILFFFLSNKYTRQDIYNLIKEPATISRKLLIILAVMTISLVMLIDFITGLIPMPEFYQEILKQLIKPDIFLFFTVVVAAPVLEELFFRGIILSGFLKKYSPRKAIILSAVIFGMAHLNPWQFIGAGLAGLFIGWIYYKTESLIPGMLIHFINNLLGYVIMLSASDVTTSLYDVFSSKLIYFSILILSVMIFAVGVFAIKKLYVFPIKQQHSAIDKIHLN